MSTAITNANGAGSLLEDKRHSRSLDLSNSRNKQQHQRSASETDGIKIKPDIEQEIPSSSVFSLYKKLSIRQKSSISSAFSSLLQQDTKISNYRFSSPILNTDAAEAMHPLNQPNSKKQESPLHLQDQMGESKRSLPSCLQKQITQFAIDGFAETHFATHKKGLIFKRKIPLKELLCWTKDSIKQPLILANKSFYQKDAQKSFKTIQLLMNDRSRPKQFNDIDHFQSLLECGITKGSMRDEIYVQLCKQLNNNPKDESIRLGWEILCVVSVTFPPSKDLESYLDLFVQQHHGITRNNLDTYSQYVTLKLNRICSRGARGKVLTAAEIERAKEAPFKPSVFGEPLDLIMNLQKNDTRLKIPKIVTFLTRAVHDLNGKSTEGIFRVSGDADAVTDLRIRIENGNYDSTGIDDPNVPASLLKYWLRDLAEPLIPADLYQDCIQYAEQKQKVIEIIESLPELNKRIILYMIRFLQDFTDQSVIEKTLMNIYNLAMVFAPNFLRCPSTNLAVIFENSKHEQNFVKTLLTDLKLEQDITVYSELEIMHPIQ